MFGKKETGRPVDPATVRGEGVTVDRYTAAPRAEVKARFGGVDVLAILAGTLAALGTAALLSAAAASVGQIGYSSGAAEGESIGTAGLVSGLVVLLVSLFFGGWVAGRMARYDGGRNGFLVGVLFVVLTTGIGFLVGSAAGPSQIPLPTWVSGTGTSELVSAAVALLVVLLVSFLGGRLGSRWHRKVDDVLTHTVPGGIGGTKVVS